MKYPNSLLVCVMCSYYPDIPCRYPSLLSLNIVSFTASDWIAEEQPSSVPDTKEKLLFAILATEKELPVVMPTAWEKLPAAVPVA